MPPSAQSPGKRRQASLQQGCHTQKSFDLGDSGYSSVDLRPWQQRNATAEASHCVSPIESAKLELEELKSEYPQLRNPAAAAHQLLLRSKQAQQQIAAHAQQQTQQAEGGESVEARSASLPSFLQSFQKSGAAEADLSIQGLSEILAYDESLDDLDEEIKMIVARGETTSKLPLPSADDVITVLKQCEKPVGQTGRHISCCV